MATGISSGEYNITNYKQQTSAGLMDTSEGTPLTADTSTSRFTETFRWDVRQISRSDNTYEIQSVGSSPSYATAPQQCSAGQSVEAGSQTYDWIIQETDVKNKYTIATTGSGISLYWGLDDDLSGTLVQLYDDSTDQRTWWTFHNPD